VSQPDVPLGILVSARNEERSLGACLDAWAAARARWQERHAHVAVPLLVVLDDCTDGTAAIAAAHGATLVVASGGKVAAQCAGLRALADTRTPEPSSFVVCSDADVLVEPTLLIDLCAAMARPEVHVAFPRKRPLPPSRSSRLARAIHVYNERNGFASRRTWFAGHVFAIRVADLGFPSAEAIVTRAERWPADNFLQLARPLRAEDVYLSQAVVAAHGPAALAEVTACAWFRGPETLRGMRLKYRRMRAELERVERLFPEFATVRRDHGRRRYDRLMQASASELAAFGLFQAAVLLCRADYWVERTYYRHLSNRPCPLWPPIEETKLRPGDAIASCTSSCGTPSRTDAPSPSGETTPDTRTDWPRR
jgi:glycosyltransferase involved in cell wall biosynthesis